MNDTLKELIEVLKRDERLIVDGRLAKNKVIELALQLDVDLLKLLRSSKDLTNTFFQQVDDVLVFDKVKFQSYISNKQFLPDSFTEYKNKIGLISDKHYLTDNEEVVLAFPYKDCILEGGQTKEDAKRSEVFWNETLAPDEIDKLLEPKVLTNFKKYDSNGEKPVNNITLEDNLIIKGNNLLALHTLKKTHKGEVKLIYIDPPYNTGSDSFQYNDNFNHSAWLTFMRNRLMVAHELLKKDGAIFVHIDHHELGYINILLDEIFKIENKVQIIAVKTASPAGFKTVNPGPIDVTEYILFYTKSKKDFSFKKMYVPSEYDDNYDLWIENLENNPNEWKLKPLVNKVYEASGITIGNTPQASNKNAKEKWGEHWKVIRHQIIANFALEFADRVVSIRDPHKPSQKIKDLLEKSKLETEKVFTYTKDGEDEDSEEKKVGHIYNGGALSFYSNKIKNIDDISTPTVLLTDFWSDISWDGIAKEGGVKLKNGKKPEKLLSRIIELCTEKDELVLDYHLGSGTTCAVAHKMGRRYIGIEQLDYSDNDSVIRLQNVINGDSTGVSNSAKWQGGGSFIYVELAQVNQIFVDKIQDSKNTKELLEVWGEMKTTAFLSYKIKPEDIDATKKDFESLSFEDQQKFLISILDKNLLYVPYSEIEDATYRVSQEDIDLNHKFYTNK